MRLLLPLLLLLTTVALPLRAQEGPPEPERIVVHLSSLTDNLHAANMALKLGALLQRQGAEVTLFVDLEGARLGDIRQPLNMVWGNGPNVGDLLADFLKSGAKARVCPHCAAAIGLTDAQLREGFQIADAAEIAEMLLKADKVMDY
jgi:predicted peroxiredoxin